MDLARFYRAIHLLLSEIDSRGTLQALPRLIQQVDRAASDPNNATIKGDFRDSLNALRESTIDTLAIADADVELVSDNLRLDGVIGNGLQARVQQAIAESSLTPQQLADALRSINEEISKKIESIRTLDREFAALGLEPPRSDDDEAEVMTRVPVSTNGVTLEDLSKEAKDWHRIFEAIREVFDDGSGTAVELRTIAQGSWLWYVAGSAAFLFGVAKCLKGVNLIMMELLRGRELLAKLLESKTPDSALQPLKAHQDSKINTDIKALSDALVDDYYKGTDTGRRNELKTALHQQLVRLSKKLSEGSTLRLRLSPPKHGNHDGTDDTGNNKTLTDERYSEIKAEVETVKSLPSIPPRDVTLLSAFPQSDEPNS